MNQQSLSHNNMDSPMIGLSSASPVCCRKTEFCVTSKPVVLILSWTVFIGALYFILIYTVLVTLTFDNLLPGNNPSLPYVVLYSSIAVIFICYPVSGYFADVHCGRFKTITASICLIMSSLLVLLICLLLSSFLQVSSSWDTVFHVIILICFLIAVVGLSGYGANFIQFGLDQLLDEPNRYQCLYVNWAKWCMDLVPFAITFMF